MVHDREKNERTKNVHAILSLKSDFPISFLFPVCWGFSLLQNLVMGFCFQLNIVFFSVFRCGRVKL